MISTHQTSEYLTRLESSVPAEVFADDGTITRASFVGTVRNDLLPSICYGPNYRRAVVDHLRRAVHAYRRGDGDAALLYLGDAVKAAR